MQKIVHIIDNLKTGGAEVLLLSTLKKLSNYKHCVITLTPECDLDEVSNYAQVYCLQHAGWHTLFRSSRRLKKVVHEIRPDFVHAHLFLSSFIARLVLGNQYNLIYSLHNLYSETVFKSRHLRWMEKQAYSSKHKVIAVSEYVLSDYQKVVKRCQKGFVLYNFIDDVFFEKSCESKTEKQRMPAKWVAVGSFKAQKNYLGMITAFAAFIKSIGEDSKISLDIYGDGPLRKEMEAAAIALQAPVNFMGKVHNIQDILCKYDAYISTSSYEGYGIAPMEALAKGLPLFLSDIPVYREIYKDHCFFFEVGQNVASALVAACTRYSNLSDDEKNSLKIEGQQYAYAVANSETYRQKLMDIYNC